MKITDIVKAIALFIRNSTGLRTEYSKQALGADSAIIYIPDRRLIVFLKGDVIVGAYNTRHALYGSEMHNHFEISLCQPDALELTAQKVNDFIHPQWNRITGPEASRTD